MAGEGAGVSLNEKRIESHFLVFSQQIIVSASMKRGLKVQPQGDPVGDGHGSLNEKRIESEREVMKNGCGANYASMKRGLKEHV